MAVVMVAAAMVTAVDTVVVMAVVMVEADGLPALPPVGHLDGRQGPGDLEAAAALGPHLVRHAGVGGRGPQICGWGQSRCGPLR